MPAGQERPPFEPGNTAALEHGAYSPAAIERRAAEVHDALLAEAPWLDEPRFAPSVHRYLQATAREQLAHEALTARGADGKGFTRLMEAATAASRLAWSMADALGLTPAGHAKLKTLTAVAERSVADLAQLGAEGRQALDGRTVDAEADAVEVEA